MTKAVALLGQTGGTRDESENVSFSGNFYGNTIRCERNKIARNWTSTSSSRRKCEFNCDVSATRRIMNLVKYSRLQWHQRMNVCGQIAARAATQRLQINNCVAQLSSRTSHTRLQCWFHRIASSIMQRSCLLRSEWVRMHCDVTARWRTEPEH